MGNRYTIKDFIIELPDRVNKVYIVGADSYLGAHYAKYWLETGATVYGCGKEKKLSECLSKVNYSTTDYKSWNFTASSYDWIVFCHDPREGNAHVEVARSMFENLEANEISAKICYPSSFMICESSKRGITEECRTIPHSELEMTIATAELYLNMKSYNSKYRLITYIHRFGEIYGDEIGCHNLPGLVNQYWQNAKQMEAIKMHGMGLQSRTLTHIADACRNSIQCMNLDFCPRTINIAGEKMSIADFTMLISLHFDVETTFASPEEQNVYCNSYAGDQHLSSSLMKTIIDCKLQYTFRKWLKVLPQLVEHSA